MSDDCKPPNLSSKPRGSHLIDQIAYVSETKYVVITNTFAKAGDEAGRLSPV